MATSCCVVGKRPRKTRAGSRCIHHISPTPSLHIVLSLVCNAQCKFVRGEDLDAAAAAARRHLRASPPCVLPPAIKPFPTNVSSSVTKTAPANVIRTVLSSMAVAILLGELPTCRVIKIPDDGFFGSSRKVSITVSILNKHGRIKQQAN